MMMAAIKSAWANERKKNKSWRKKMSLTKKNEKK